MFACQLFSRSAACIPKGIASCLSRKERAKFTLILCNGKQCSVTVLPPVSLEHNPAVHNAGRMRHVIYEFIYVLCIMEFGGDFNLIELTYQL